MRRVRKETAAAVEEMRQVAEFITDQVRDVGWPPSVREIGEFMGWSSPSQTHETLNLMEDRGLISRVPGSPRAIRVDREALAELRS